MSLRNNPMWTKLADREKRLVIGLGIFLVTALLYSLIWAPIQNGFTEKTAALQKAESDWLWLVEQAPKAMASQGNHSASKLRLHSKTALMDALQKSLRQQKLLESAEGLNLNNRGVTVSFEQVDAPRLFRWVAALEQQGLTAKSMELIPISTGVTKAEIAFEVAK